MRTTRRDALRFGLWLSAALGSGAVGTVARATTDGLGTRFKRIATEESFMTKEVFGGFLELLANEPESEPGFAHYPDFARWISEHAYGRVLSRPGLEPRMRELCAVVALTVTGQARQLASHVRGAVRLGSDRETLQAVLSRVEAHTPPEALERARACVEQFGR